MKNIIWLASYPKSGNTWLRVFLSNLLQDGEEPTDINQLDRTPIASARTAFDDAIKQYCGRKFDNSPFFLEDRMRDPKTDDFCLDALLKHCR